MRNSSSTVAALQSKIPGFLEVAPRQRCEGMAHLDRFLQDIIDKGGEGVIVRDPELEYEPGRSRGFLKHKVRFHY